MAKIATVPVSPRNGTSSDLPPSMLDSNLHNNISAGPQTTSSRTTGRTLIIGDSILKGIHRRGLSGNIDIKTLRGATAEVVYDQLYNMPLSRYDCVIVYIGGNDIAQGKTPCHFCNDLNRIIELVQKHVRTMYLCTVSPRSDVNVSQVNKVILEKCLEKSVPIIDVHRSFVFGNGNTVVNYYTRDGIHLNKTGTSTLLFTINNEFKILKTKLADSHGASHSYQSFNQFRGGRHQRRATGLRDNYGRHVTCRNCGRSNHASRECRYIMN
jgi:hypothetical protein